MPEQEFDRMFKKRLSEADYGELKQYFMGKKTFDDVDSSARKVLSAISKEEMERDFTEQEQLFELQQRLGIDGLIPHDSDMWDKFEVTYRTFMLGEAARHEGIHRGGAGSNCCTYGRWPIDKDEGRLDKTNR